MNRLDVKLPEFTRVAWVSEQARKAWEYRIDAIITAWSEIERSTVLAGIRAGGLQAIEPDNLTRFQQWCFDQNIGMAILGRAGVTPVYGNAMTPVVEGQPWTYRVYYGLDPAGFAKAWGTDELKVGKLLGYPSCCSTFFRTFWTEAGWRDLTYPMASCESGRVVGPATCNILLRHIGVRSVFHLPCSFNCVPTDILGKQILEHGAKTGFADEMGWINEMLNWPVRWSSLHGVAIVTTPILKIVFSSDALAEAAVLDREGDSYPAEGATGVEFPFRSTRPMMLQGLDDTWSDNGFPNLFAMRHAHDQIIDAIADLPIQPGRVLDLGCGNGVLLEKIRSAYPSMITAGVDLDEDKCHRAALRKNTTFQCDIVDTQSYLADKYELILISLNRFKELNFDLLLYRLREHTRFLLVYTYEDWDDAFNDVFDYYFEPVGKANGGIVKASLLRSKNEIAKF